ncbi:MAG: MBL fold metallo-hydrolase [Lachnospiraceae bacterium]|nr:MBL fold metallo-hydrolase [Lachnospiraceae bacterium]GFI02228.1 ribonuclease BN [Lachnospiraceae bacterium]
MSDNKLCITMLGTGHATVTKCYNTCFVLRENNQCFMVDAGGGNQILRILEEQEIPLTQIHDLFVTHAHSDHILGAVWIIRMIGQLLLNNKYDGNLKIYAHEEVVDQLQTICRIVLMTKITDLFDRRFVFIKLHNGDSHHILNREITFFDIKSTKLLQYGFKIKENSLFFCGDEPLNKEFYDDAADSDYLLHEAFCLYSEREKFKPYEKHHSTVKDVCSMAEDLHIKNLLLMHTEDSHIADRKKLYADEGQKFYSGNLVIPGDGESIMIEK